ncbi:hypothetical protein J6590_091792, partial [Homalodisca vitripennis]
MRDYSDKKMMNSGKFERQSINEWIKLMQKHLTNFNGICYKLYSDLLFKPLCSGRELARPRGNSPIPGNR